MKYLLMIYANEAADAARSEAEQRAEMGEYFAYTQEVEKAGVLKGGEALHPSSTATVVRVRNGKVSTTDGPFAETKEQLAGYYLVESANLDEAIQWAAKIPHAKISSIEVRPVMDFSQEASA
jgi:hypothetical protein